MFCGRIKWWSNRLSDDPLALTQLYISNQYTSYFVFIGFSLEEKDYLKQFSSGITFWGLFTSCHFEPSVHFVQTGFTEYSPILILRAFWKTCLNIQLGMQQGVPPLSVRVSFLSQWIFIAFQKKQTSTILIPALASLANEFASQVLQKKQHPPS